MTCSRLFATVGLAAALTVSGCSQTVNPATGRSEFTTISTEQEAKLGAQEHPKILKQFGGAYTEGGVDRYVEALGQRLAANSELAGQRFTFTVLDDPVVNAFALPGGFIYVTRGMLALIEDEAQLAGVVGHEIGHVTGRHAAQRQTRSTVAGLGALAATLGAAALGVGGDAVRGIGQLTQVAAKGTVASFSREQELEADRLGVRYISRAGYDPFAHAEILDNMQRQVALAKKLKGRTDDPNRVSFFDTHPATGQRVNQAVQAAQASGVPINSGAPRNRDAYLRAIDGMIYGDNTKDGFVRGRNFIHVPLNFALTAPPNYEIVNTNDAVVMKLKGAKNVGTQFSAAKRETGDMLAYVRKAAKQRDGGERLSINGFPAATITKSGSNGSVFGRLVAIDAGDSIYRFLFVAPANQARRYDSDFRNIANSFRRLTPSDRAAARPYRLRIHTVGYGETVESLASRLPFEEEKIERFRVLNGLKPGEQVQPGQLVKLVQ